MMELFLTLVSGIAWTVVYIESIRLGFKHKTYTIPFFALVLNIAWEGLYAFHGLSEFPLEVQPWVNLVWFILDLGIVASFFLFSSRKSEAKDARAFTLSWSLLGLVMAIVLQIAFLCEFKELGIIYSAFIQNLIMSVTFVGMLMSRKSAEGQSLLIAIAKMLGTLAPSILFTIVTKSVLIMSLGAFCAIYDLIYIGLLTKRKYYRLPE
jgi:hypothetical protein